ncbi:MAG: hypothetical protein AAFO94_03410 [Bacteroidota bacterium]
MAHKSMTVFDQLIGKTFDGMRCDACRVYGDLLVLSNKMGFSKAYESDAARKQEMKPYLINGEEVMHVRELPGPGLLLLETGQGISLRDFQNQVVDDSGKWKDYFFEPHMGALYRQDAQGSWFDVEGYKLEAPVFLQDDVLISLVGKTSRRSLSFRGHTLVTSAHYQLLQIGKLVYNAKLKTVFYYGERITGLGTANIEFPDREPVQEVLIGLERRAFIKEYSYEPFVIHEKSVDKYHGNFVQGDHHFEIFEVERRKLAIDFHSGETLLCDEQPVNVDFKSYVQLGALELVKVKKDRKAFYMNLRTGKAFFVADISSEPIIYIDQLVYDCQGVRLRNMATATRRFVFNESEENIFTLNDAQYRPEAVESVDRYEEVYGLSIRGKDRKIFYKHSRSIVSLQGGQYEIEKILSAPGHRLLNAVSTMGEAIVLDARRGYQQLSLALSGERRLEKTIGEPLTFADTMVLQNVWLKTLGGHERRVIDLNDSQLSVFTLPPDLLAYEGDTLPSTFQRNPIVEIEFKNPVRVAEQVFYKARFINFDGKPVAVLINRITGRPLHLEGSTHRNELVVGFIQDTLKQHYMLGPHRLLGVQTLTEEQQSNQILFCMDEEKTALSFGESYFPILRRVIVQQQAAEWDYWIYETQTARETTPEYIVVEKKAPHRVLVSKAKGREVIKLITEIDDVLAVPKKMSRLMKVFLSDPGYLKVIH